MFMNLILGKLKELKIVGDKKPPATEEAPLLYFENFLFSFYKNSLGQNLTYDEFFVGFNAIAKFISDHTLGVEASMYSFYHEPRTIMLAQFLNEKTMFAAWLPESENQVIESIKAGLIAVNSAGVMYRYDPRNKIIVVTNRLGKNEIQEEKNFLETLGFILQKFILLDPNPIEKSLFFPGNMANEFNPFVLNKDKPDYRLETMFPTAVEKIDDLLEDIIENYYSVMGLYVISPKKISENTTDFPMPRKPVPPTTNIGSDQDLAIKLKQFSKELSFFFLTIGSYSNPATSSLSETNSADAKIKAYQLIMKNSLSAPILNFVKKNEKRINDLWNYIEWRTGGKITRAMLDEEANGLYVNSDDDLDKD
ncbi:MAG: hypothetical protein QE271_04530 [Bacteriovoracaceae bacterium]|nr:hypothetical protein [Bacteriovoracaceae bacterium]